jgi:hypothetical protein
MHASPMRVGKDVDLQRSASLTMAEGRIMANAVKASPCYR